MFYFKIFLCKLRFDWNNVIVVDSVNDYKKRLISKIIKSESESVKFSLIESVICLFTDSSVKKIFLTVKLVNFH